MNKMTQEQILSPVFSFEECIIETPLVEIILDGVSQGLHNEYTVRKLGLAVKRKELTYKNIRIILFGKEHLMEEDGHISPHLKGFSDITYILALNGMD